MRRARRRKYQSHATALMKFYGVRRLSAAFWCILFHDWMGEPFPTLKSHTIKLIGVERFG